MNKRQRKKWLKKNNMYVNPKECWDLDTTMSKFILPRLKIFRKQHNTYPMRDEAYTPEQWDECLDKMIRAFDLESRWDEICFREALDDSHLGADFDYQAYLDEIHEGLRLFAKFYMDLWW